MVFQNFRRVLVAFIIAELVLFSIWFLYEPKPGVDEARYFLSAAAQVWAALIAFGAFLVRDRSLRYEDAMNHYFEISGSNLRTIESFLRAHRIELPFEIYIHRADLEKCFEKNQNFENIIKKLSENDYSLSDYPEAIQRAAAASSYKDDNINYIPCGKYVLAALAGGVRAFEMYQSRRDNRRLVDAIFPWIVSVGGLLVFIPLMLIVYSNSITTSGSCLNTWFLGILALSILEFFLFGSGFIDDGTGHQNQIARTRQLDGNA